MFLLVWPIKPHLEHSTNFLIQNTKVHILLKQKQSQGYHNNMPVSGTNFCLRGSIAVKKHYDHRKRYKVKLLIEAGL